MKRFVVLLLSIFLLFGCGSPATDTASTSNLTDGTYEGVGQGKNGDVKISITIENGEIVDGKVVETKETAGYASASDVILENVIASNSLDVDIVTGSTMTSEATLEAIKDCLAQAGGSEADLIKKEVGEAGEKELIVEEHQVVVVGAGGAGLVAAIEAKNNGVEDVIIIEKMPFVGGNTLISGAEMAAPGNHLQEAEGIEDSADLYYEDVLVAGGDPALVRVLADNSLEDSKWMADEIGVIWIDELMFFGGHTVKRSLIPLGNRGTELITKLEAKAKDLGIKILLNTAATELITDDSGAVVGVKAEGKDADYEFNAKAVILATGGFGNNVEMRVKYDPSVDDSILSTNAAGIDGDGIVMAEAVGADLVGMEYIQLYPVCHPETGALLYVDDVRLFGATIIVNEEGERFVEELETRYVMSMAVKEQTGSVAYELMTLQAAIDAGVLENHKAEVDDLMENGFLVQADTLEEVAELMGVDPDNLVATVEKWNSYVDGGKDLDFNKRGKLFRIDEAPYWLLKFAPAVHHTMGGVKIDTSTHVINTEGEIIPGLYAAGEVTGGIHGNNRLGSVAIADIVVFGRIAGQTAAKEIAE